MIRSVNGSGMKRMALLNDLSCFGKCSLSVAMPILSAFGVEAVPLPTAILSTHTAEGFGDYVLRSLTDEMETFAAHWKRLGIRFDGVCTGFLLPLHSLLSRGGSCAILPRPVRLWSWTPCWATTARSTAALQTNRWPPCAHSVRTRS